MTAWGYNRGRKSYYDVETKEWLYADTHEPCESERPCPRCGHQHEIDDPDFCLGFLGENVISACCGHGVEPGYIVLKDGRYFEEKYTLPHTEEQSEE